MRGVDGEAEEAPAPAVPDRDQRAGERGVGVREEQRVRVVVEQELERLDAVARAGRRSGDYPQREHILQLAAGRVADVRR